MGNFCAQPSISAMSSKLKTQHVCRPHRGVYINTVNAARSPPTRLHPFVLPAACYSAAETKRQSQAEAGLRLPGGGPAEEAAAWHGRAARRSRQRGGAQPSGAGAPSSTRQSVTCQLAGRHSRASQPGAGEQMASVTLRNQGVNWSWNWLIVPQNAEMGRKRLLHNTFIINVTIRSATLRNQMFI